MRALLGFVATLALSGCASIGPATIPRDRVDYAGAMAESWKEQTLLNIVKLRYFDTPMYVDVASVVASHELLTELTATSRVVPHPMSSAASYFNIDARGRYTDRPTISYVPLAGERFINGLLRPLPPQTVFALMEAGHPADFVLQMSVRAINDVSNISRSPPRARAGSPEFAELIAALRRVQRAGAIGMRTEKRDGHQVTLISFRSIAGGTGEGDVRFVKQVLRLDPQKQEYVLASGSYRRDADEVAMLTRSIQEIMVELSIGVEVPSDDLAEGRVARIGPIGSGDIQGVPLLRIRSDAEAPADAFEAVRYRHSWFWVDDRDMSSKRIFMFLRMFASLAETGVVPQAAIVTIPAR
jgi:hypothetical protein